MAMHTAHCRLIAVLSSPAAAQLLLGIDLTPEYWRMLLHQLDVYLLYYLKVQRLKQCSPLSAMQFLIQAPR